MPFSSAYSTMIIHQYFTFHMLAQRPPLRLLGRSRAIAQCITLADSNRPLRSSQLGEHYLECHLQWIYMVLWSPPQHFTSVWQSEYGSKAWLQSTERRRHWFAACSVIEWRVDLCASWDCESKGLLCHLSVSFALSIC